jgi:hypothetical protein
VPAILAILAEEFEGIGVVDGRLTASRGVGTAPDFGLTLVESPSSAGKGAEIRRSIRA